MTAEKVTFEVVLTVTHGIKRDDLYKGACTHCDKPLYEGDTVYKSDFGTFCAECFAQYVMDDLLTTA